jgi:hypothetical protein
LGLFDVPVQAIGGMHRDVIQGRQTGGQSAGSRALQNYGQQVAGLWSDVFKPGPGQTPVFQPREFEAAGEAAVGRFGLEGAGASAARGGATALDLLTGFGAGGVGAVGRQGASAAADTGIAIKRGADALGEIGVRGPSAFVMSAADPAGAQAARNLPRSVDGAGIGGLNIPVEDSSGINAAILRYLGRHRSKNPLLNLGVQHPRDVPIDSGRAAAGGTYFGTSREASDAGFSNFGNEVYRIQEPLWNVWNTVRNSPGYITTGALQRRMPARIDLNDAEALSIGPSTAWDNPLMQQLRDEGYLGYRYADDAFTDWTVGAKPFVGLSKESGSSTGGVSDFLQYLFNIRR